MSNIADSMDSYFTDEGFDKDSAVRPTINLPTFYIHNPGKPNEQGGLLILEKNLPEGCAPDPKAFRQIDIAFNDKSSPDGFRVDKGWIADHYHLVVYAFDYTIDRNGVQRPRIWKSSYEGEERWVIYIYGQVWEAWSPATPVRIKMGGWTNAKRTEDHLHNFDHFIVGTATAEKQKDAIRTGRDFMPASRNQFLLPVWHKNELVGTSQQSWVSAVQEYLDRGLKISGEWGRRNGISTLKAYVEDNAEGKAREKLMKLFIPALPEGPERIPIIREQMALYKGMLGKFIEPKSAAVATTQADGKLSFTEDADLAVTKEQLADIAELSAGIGKDPEVMVQILRGENYFTGGDDNSTHFDLTREEGDRFIKYLRDRLKAVPKQTAAPAAARQTERVAERRPPTIDDDIVF